MDALIRDSARGQRGFHLIVLNLEVEKGHFQSNLSCFYPRVQTSRSRVGQLGSLSPSKCNIPRLAFSRTRPRTLSADHARALFRSGPGRRSGHMYGKNNPQTTRHPRTRLFCEVLLNLQLNLAHTAHTRSRHQTRSSHHRLLDHDHKPRLGTRMFLRGLPPSLHDFPVRVKHAVGLDKQPLPSYHHRHPEEPRARHHEPYPP